VFARTHGKSCFSEKFFSGTSKDMRKETLNSENFSKKCFSQIFHFQYLKYKIEQFFFLIAKQKSMNAYCCCSTIFFFIQQFSI
jgi:hypothetical protein